MRKFVVTLFFASGLLAGCQQRHGDEPPLGQTSFAEYQQQTRDFVAAHRAFQTLDKEAELRLNTPQEWRPAQTPHKGILLVHGLGDGPGSFTDIAPALAKQGFLVRLAAAGSRDGVTLISEA